MASYNKNIDSGLTTQVQTILSGLGADLGSAGIDGKWGAYTDAAYNQYKDQVDAALAGSNGSAFSGYYSSVTPHTHYSAPSINYTPRTLDELMAEAQGLIGGEYDAQLLAAKQGYEASQQSLAKTYENTRKTTQDSAVSRGMGRSSYLTDAIANVGLAEKQDNATLTGNYNDQVYTLEKAQAEAISSYVQQLQREQDELMLQKALAEAELQYKYDALNASLASAASAASGSYSSGGSSSSSNPNKQIKDKTSDYVSSLANAASNNSSTSFVADYLNKSASNAAGKGEISSANAYIDTLNRITGSNTPYYGTTTSTSLNDKNAMSNSVKNTNVSSTNTSSKNLQNQLVNLLNKLNLPWSYK